jgi:hypothetical protein
MGMVRISYEQMEQLREYKSDMQVPLSRLVAEALSHWLKFIAPAKLDALRVTPPTPVSKDQLRSSSGSLASVETLRSGEASRSGVAMGVGRRHTLRDGQLILEQQRARRDGEWNFE